MVEKESFETALQGLEEAVERLESGELSLEAALHTFEQGVNSASSCRKALKAVETRVELLLKDADGNLSVEEFDRE